MVPENPDWWRERLGPKAIERNAFNYHNLSNTALDVPLLPEKPGFYRLKMSLQQSAMASSLGISLRQWQYYESGEKTMPRNDALALRALWKFWTRQQKENSPNNYL